MKRLRFQARGLQRFPDRVGEDTEEKVESRRALPYFGANLHGVAEFRGDGLAFTGGEGLVPGDRALFKRAAFFQVPRFENLDRVQGLGADAAVFGVVH